MPPSTVRSKERPILEIAGAGVLLFLRDNVQKDLCPPPENSTYKVSISPPNYETQFFRNEEEFFRNEAKG